MATPQSELGAELERRFYPLAELVVRLRQMDPDERRKALQTPYGRHVGYILKLLSDWAEEGGYADWPNLPANANLERQIQARAGQDSREKQAKQLYR